MKNRSTFAIIASFILLPAIAGGAWWQRAHRIVPTDNRAGGDAVIVDQVGVESREAVR